MRKFICWLIGHKDAGRMLEISVPVGDNVHVLEHRACYRCTVYSQTKKVPVEEWLADAIIYNPDYAAHRTLH